MSVLSCEGVLFDCDGVLVDSDASVLRSWRRWAVDLGLEPDDVTAVVFGRRSADTVAMLVEPAKQADALELIDALEMRDAVTVSAIPGALELLACLPPAMWATVTSGSVRLATARLSAAGVSLPKHLITADDVTQGKPHPEGFLAGARLLGVPPEKCVVFEDAPAGIRAARAAGVAYVVGVGDRPLGDDTPDFLVPDLRAVHWTETGLEINGEPFTGQ